MLAIAIAMLGAVLTFGYIDLYEPRLQQTHINATGDVAAASFWAYQNAVARYAFANPTFTGVVADNALSFPPGYITNAAWTNYVVNGTPYTYSVSTLPMSAITAIGQRGGMSLMIGIANNGTMTSLNNIATGFVLPAVVPNGAVVVIGD